jgi:hypothetical protein
MKKIVNLVLVLLMFGSGTLSIHADEEKNIDLLGIISVSDLKNSSHFT